MAFSLTLVCQLNFGRGQVIISTVIPLLLSTSAFWTPFLILIPSLYSPRRPGGTSHRDRHTKTPVLSPSTSQWKCGGFCQPKGSRKYALSCCHLNDCYLGVFMTLFFTKEKFSLLSSSFFSRQKNIISGFSLCQNEERRFNLEGNFEGRQQQERSYTLFGSFHDFNSKLALSLPVSLATLRYYWQGSFHCVRKGYRFHVNKIVKNSKIVATKL